MGAAVVESAINLWLGRVTDRVGSALPIRVALVGSILVSLALAATEWPWLLVPLVFTAAITFGGFYTPGLTMLSHSAEHVGLAHGGNPSRVRYAPSIVSRMAVREGPAFAATVPRSSRSMLEQASSTHSKGAFGEG